MKRFRDYLKEENTTSNMVYLFQTGAGFAIDKVSTNFDVEDFPEKRKAMKPWEVRNALDADQRRGMVLRWLEAAGGGGKNSVTDDSLPLTPNWQSEIR